VKRCLVQVLLCGALSAVAAVPLLHAFGGYPVAAVRAVFAAVAVAVVYGIAASVWPSREALTTVAGVLAVAGVVAVLAHPGAAVLSGPHRLLTTALPADPAGPELATVAALAGYLALASVYLVLRFPTAPAFALPALLVLAAGLSLTPSLGAPPPWCAPAFAALAALTLLAAQLLDRRGAIPFLAGVLAVGLAASAALPWLASTVPSGHRAPADVRAAVPAHVQPRQRVDPMAQFLAIREGRIPVSVTGTATAPVTRLRMVTLTAFDGSGWTVRADYRRAGTHLPAAPSGTDTVTADLTVDTPATIDWLPTAGRATEISVAGLGVDESTGDVVVPEGTATPGHYVVTGAEVGNSTAALTADQPAHSAGSPIPLPLALLTHVRSTTAGSADDYERLSRLYAAFHDDTSPYRLDNGPNPPSGNGFYQITKLLEDRRGTTEQYASAYAAFCRSLGLDARVVLGFLPVSKGAGFTATGRNLAAWVEIRFTHLGWIPLDPSPTRDTSGATAPAPPDPVGSTVAEDKHDRDRPVPAPPTQSTTGPAAAPTRRSHRPYALIAVAAVAGLALLTVASIPVTRLRRRHRRRGAADPRAQVVGAWHEAIDTLAAHRLPVSARTTAGQTVATAGRLAAPHVGLLADQADHASYSPDPITPADATTAWQHTAAIRSRTARATPLLTRARATLLPTRRR
jgi:protein-glutamine gamma-glutamyltransferase